MTDVQTEAQTNFDSMKLGASLLRALHDVGYTGPTAVQSAAFEGIAAGRDVIVQSRTGSGKTAAFVIPVLDRLLKDDAHPQVIVLCPTRELALQVAGEFERLGAHMNLIVAPLYGGAAMERQVSLLKSGARVVVGTPGRTLDHLRRRTLDPRNIRIVILDEGDEMLSMGFAEELNAILEQLPKTRQGVILSATMPEGMRRIASRHLREPEVIALSSDRIAPDELTHMVYFSPTGARPDDLARVIELEKPTAALIFCNMKSETESVCGTLQARGFKAEFLNGDMAQSDRERVMGMLRDERVQFLVATDVAARGIDIPHLTHVINVGLPETAEVYVHRTGRTGRAGRAGTAITVAGPKDIGALYFLRLTYGIRPIERVLPTAGEERTRREADKLQMLLEGFPAAPSEESAALAKRLLTHDDAERVVASLLGAFFDLERRDRVGRTLSEGASEADEPPGAAATARAPEEAPVKNERRSMPPPGRDRPRGDAPSGDRGPRRGEVRGERRPLREPERPRKIDVRHAPTQVVKDLEDGDEAGMEEIRFAVGRKENLRAGDILHLLVDTLKLNKRDIGRIHVRDRFTLVNLRPEHVAPTLEALRDTQWNNRALSPERGRGTAVSVATPPAETAEAPVEAGEPPVEG